MNQNISLTEESMKYLDELIQNPDKYQVKISEVNDATIIDCGIESEGSISAGLLFTKISLGGITKVNLDFPGDEKNPLMTMRVETSHPVLATIGCQAASWNINKDDFFGMACGPGRAVAQKPSKSYKLINYKDEAKQAVLCIEADKLPTDKVIDYLAEKCKVAKNDLTILMIKTNCIVEYLQMAARAIELGVFKLVEQLGYPQERILHAVGTGVVAPMTNDIDLSNDRVNNALIYGTRLYLIINSAETDNLNELVKQIPSASSPSFGRKFLELFTEANGDFSKFDLNLLAPSEVILNDIRTGKIYKAGKMDLSFIIE